MVSESSSGFRTSGGSGSPVSSPVVTWVGLLLLQNWNKPAVLLLMGSVVQSWFWCRAATETQQSCRMTLPVQPNLTVDACERGRKWWTEKRVDERERSRGGGGCFMV